jgi:hypothetical protein
MFFFNLLFYPNAGIKRPIVKRIFRRSAFCAVFAATRNFRRRVSHFFCKFARAQKKARKAKTRKLNSP